MPWSNAPHSDRARRLPRDWPTIRRRVLQRDLYQCQLRYPDICIGQATDVDHDDTGSDDDQHLRSACRPCHARRSSQQGTASLRRIASSRWRPAEPSPGLIPRTPRP